jgi:membrane-bound lytic murein transglycosylase D
MFQRIRARAKEYALLVSVLALAGCASSPARKAGPPSPSPEQAAMEAASRAFDIGREAALSGDGTCAADAFGRAIDALRPIGAAPPSDPHLREFSEDLFEAILRYEALAAPADESAGDRIAPELRQIEAPVSSPEEISRAATAVATDTAGVTYDIPIVANESVLRILAVFQNDLHDVIGRGLARSGRYVPMIHRIFREEGVPADLAQVALIESSFLPRARSNKAAHGIWQFMLRTGRQYGLTANAVVDQRSDPEKATRAAAKHLKYLNLLFHDWYLALAAYNAGEGKVLKAMARTGFSDFWQLAASPGALKPQTISYVPAVIAATLIAKNPTHYGFDVEYEKPLEYETVELKRPVRLKNLADGQHAPLEELQRLNPELTTEVTPRDAEGYELKVPLGTREAVLAAYATAPTATAPSYRRHVARRGETLAGIAHRFRVPVAVLAELNSVAPKARLPRGRVILVPRPEKVQIASGKKPKKKTAKVVATADRTNRSDPSEKKTYRVRGGDTLYRIALKHGTTVALLMTANSLGSPASIRPGDRLTIPPKNQ